MVRDFERITGDEQAAGGPLVRFWANTLLLRTVWGKYSKSVAVVDTISTTVIFYLFTFWGCFEPHQFVRTAQKAPLCRDMKF